MEDLSRLSVEDFKNADKMPVVIVLDNVRSLHNVGSVFRTSDGFAVEAIYLCGITGTPPHREIEKTALGATNSVQWKYFEHTTDALLELRQNAYAVYALEQVKESVSLADFVPKKTEKCAFVFGNEVNGVSQEVVNMVDACIEIPQFGTKHSFNISITVGIVLWSFFEKTRE